ncbi:MAG: homocysteine biosynthesis protein [Acidobacteria bacterium]|nr:homocysteine biosynthesis protein [Acidobacteriota bacterium]
MKTIDEINSRIKSGKAIVLTASEVKKLAEENNPKEIAQKVDVVTTATFSPMCSSGIFINTGHTKPPMKFQKVTLDGVPAYGGIAAADIYLGATEENPENPRFGGAHVIQKLISGESVHLEAKGKPSDCYPRNEVSGDIRLETLNQAFFFNPRNAYQNYNAATNSSDKKLWTYMGALKPDFGCVNFSTTGELSPLLNDPEFRTLGVGSRIFFGGGDGYIAWEGTQFNSEKVKDPETGLPLGPAGTIAIIADLRNMKSEYIKAIYIHGYGVSIALAIAAAIPVLDEDIAKRVSIRNHEIKTSLIDYATGNVIKQINYEELYSRRVELNGKTVPARTMTNITESRKIMRLMKERIIQGEFLLTKPVLDLPQFGRQGSFRG